MSALAGPFTDPSLVRGALYASADRLARRSAALGRARISGRHAGQVITDLAADALGPGGRAAQVADIGCGRGTTTRMLALRLPAAKVVAFDLSAALLAVARNRLPSASPAGAVRADFCHLPLASGACDVMVAAFCLYHCARPEHVIGEIARCLRPGGGWHQPAPAPWSAGSAPPYRMGSGMMGFTGWSGYWDDMGRGWHAVSGLYGPAFDTAWTAMMARGYTAEIALAQRELRSGVSTRARGQAATMIAWRRAGLTRLQRWYRAWGGPNWNRPHWWNRWNGWKWPAGWSRGHPGNRHSRWNGWNGWNSGCGCW